MADTRNTDTKEAERLIEKFFDGTTSDSEERQLYAYFASGSVAPHLKRYSAMFAGFAALPEKPARRGKVRRMWMAAASAAAAIAVVAGIATASHIAERRHLDLCYGGSYIIENGQRTDDLRQIIGDIRQALGDADRIREMSSATATAKMAQQELLDCIDDPAQRRKIKEMLEQ